MFRNSSQYILIFILSVSLAAQHILVPSALYAQMPAASFASHPLIQGMTLDSDNPFHFDFHIDQGDEAVSADILQQQSMTLIRYFLAALTIPEDQLWVNLSPTEPDRIAPIDLQKTELGRVMLEEDLKLKALVSSLLSPENEIGTQFWDKVYTQTAVAADALEAVESLNKVWIVPDEVVLHAVGKNIFIVKSHLKVMSETDYLAGQSSIKKSATNGGMEGLIEQMIIPAIEKEVNEGEQFAPLRQVFHSIILAAWYKKNLVSSILNKGYIDHFRVKGIDSSDQKIIERTYQSYLSVFQRASEGILKEGYDPASQQVVTRKYVAGGVIGRVKYLSVGDYARLAAEKFSGRPIKTFSIVLADAAMMESHKFGDDVSRQLSNPERNRLRPSYRSAAVFFHNMAKWKLEHPGWNIVIFVRHPESASNLFEYVQTPETFSPITKRGWRQVDFLEVFLKETGIVFDSFYASDQDRVYTMLDKVLLGIENGKNEKAIIPLRRLREAALLANMPHGLPNELAKKLLPVSFFELFKTNPYLFFTEIYSIGKVESSLYQLKELARGSENQNILIGTHGVTTMLSLMTFLDIPYEKFISVEGELGGNVPYVGLTGLGVDPKTGKCQMLFAPDNSFLPENLRHKRDFKKMLTKERKVEKAFFLKTMRIRQKYPVNFDGLSDWNVNEDFGKIDKYRALTEAIRLLESIGHDKIVGNIDPDAIKNYEGPYIVDRAMLNPGGIDLSTDKLDFTLGGGQYAHFFNVDSQDVYQGLGLVPLMADIQEFGAGEIFH